VKLESRTAQEAKEIQDRRGTTTTVTGVRGMDIQDHRRTPAENSLGFRFGKKETDERAAPNIWTDTSGTSNYLSCALVVKHGVCISHRHIGSTQNKRTVYHFVGGEGDPALGWLDEHTDNECIVVSTINRN